MNIDVSVIIINYNTYQLVCACIRSIIERTAGINYEIIVVDNCSPDRSIEELPTLFPDVTLILSSKNKGFGAGNNMGAAAASGRYLFFLNSDTVLINNAIVLLYHFMESVPNAAVCGGNLYTGDCEPTISFEPLKPGPFVRTYFLISQIISRKIAAGSIFFCRGIQPKRIKGYISGANFFIIKSVFDKVGGFDEDFFMYYEEIELTHRINALGLHSYIVPEAKIIHLEGGSQKGVTERRSSWMADSRILYYQKSRTKGLIFDVWEEKIIAAILKFFKSTKTL